MLYLLLILFVCCSIMVVIRTLYQLKQEMDGRARVNYAITYSLVLRRLFFAVVPYFNLFYIVYMTATFLFWIYEKFDQPIIKHYSMGERK